jgi:hypothetical protein
VSVNNHPGIAYDGLTLPSTDAAKYAYVY